MIKRGLNSRGLDEIVSYRADKRKTDFVVDPNVSQKRFFVDHKTIETGFPVQVVDAVKLNAVDYRKLNFLA